MGSDNMREMNGEDGSISPYLEIVSEGIFMYDLDNDEFIFSNSMLSKLIGVDGEKGLAPLLTLVHRDDREKIDTLIRDCRKKCDNSVREIEIRVDQAGSSTRWVKIRCRPFEDDLGRIMLAGSMKDVNSLHKARRDAQFYLDLMTHDLTNKHQVILMNLEILKNKAIGDDVSVRRFGSAVKHLGQAMDTIRSVKVLADVGLGPFEGQKTRLHDNIQEGLDIIKSLDPFIDMDLSIDLHDEDSMVLADSRLKLIFYHLVANAVLHSDKERPTIHINSFNRNEDVVVAIEDNGPGIPDWIKNELKGIEYLDISKARGRGLGLPLVISLLDFYGGSMTAEDIVSDGVESGTRVLVVLKGCCG